MQGTKPWKQYGANPHTQARAGTWKNSLGSVQAYRHQQAELQ